MDVIKTFLILFFLTLVNSQAPENIEDLKKVK